VAPVYVPALWRILDHRRPDPEPLDGSALDLEHIDVESLGKRLADHLRAA
jgi:hypothetical protein